MTRRSVPPSPEVVAELRRIADRRLTAAELDAQVTAPMTAQERQDIDDLIDWFMRRYPTPAARLAQVRGAYQAAAALMPPGRAADDRDPDQAVRRPGPLRGMASA